MGKFGKPKETLAWAVIERPTARLAMGCEIGERNRGNRLRRWLPEYEGIRFEKPQQGHKAIALQTRDFSARVPAEDLSQGTLVAFAILTLAYLPEPPAVVGLEEPDRGIHLVCFGTYAMPCIG